MVIVPGSNTSKNEEKQREREREQKHIFQEHMIKKTYYKNIGAKNGRQKHLLRFPHTWFFLSFSSSSEDKQISKELGFDSKHMDFDINSQ